LIDWSQLNSRSSEMSSSTKEEIAPVGTIVDSCTSPVYRPVIHGIELWNTILPDAYTKYLKEWKNENISLTKHSEGGVVVPFEVRDDPNKGRGLYATKDIKRGTRVWTPEHFHYIDGEEDYLAFLKYLPHNLQCEIILWTYPLAGTTTEVAITLDEGAYMNDGGPGSSRNNLDSETYAKYDIKAGDELLQDYSLYIYLDHEIVWFDDLRERAFGSYNYTQQGAPPTLRQQNENKKAFEGQGELLHDQTTQHILRSANTSFESGVALLSFVVILRTSQGLSRLWRRKYHGQ
jgi:hypothetical protein